MPSLEERAKRIFGERAAFYTTSTSHTDPAILGELVRMAAPQPGWRALDVATGTGHTAFALAPHVASVVGLDLTPEMLEEGRRLAAGRGIGNVEFRTGDAHALPFPDGSFDLVTCRRAAHHFSDLPRALAEMRRVLRPGGRLVIDDRSVPDDDFVDRTMNELDRLHDASHVRQYRTGEWKESLEAAGFAVREVLPFVKHRPIGSLTDGVAGPEARRIREILASLTPEQARLWDLREVEGVLHLNHWFVLLSADRP